ncbi:MULTISPECIES: Sec-independent protein translocase subunit TatA/TatB [Nitratiruptor]|uniref:Sec-independent protein translocase protein TatA n=1 Tax=Nitratiruptor tergarcus DSM 16512 TaxID=1069081 RepID=A0A1W1WQ08_9BACT|nr:MULTISPECIES: twin-arginine translocase TatA/TatE family subunit [Nitratiruptor]BCD62778.1 sec-independent protein translocase protein TatA [Nitratiruptor sp. YY08-13]BCD66714.1 sec-independent protein translocase protein TatA [Nitratiruptor sp. YY08-26]SMC08302.1 sec-independent protein translocase protein TatA [Nitratiruptor tergarcus DSM 16512]
MGMPSMPELLVILAIVVLLFGAKKIPELAKGLGSGIKNFKKAMKEDEEEIATDTKKEIEQKSETASTSQTTTEKKEA